MDSIETANIAEIDLNFQFKPLTVCPLPPRIKKVLIQEGNFKSEGYSPEWDKTVGDITIKIIGSPKFGVPYGRDILVVLYLIREAMRQNNDGIINFDSLNNYLKTFHIDLGHKSYKEAIERFQRIFYSTWFWTDKKNDIDKSTSFRVIRSWSVYFSEEKGTNPIFDSFIELTPDFWAMIKNNRIPYDLNTVIKIKESPAVLNLYLWLVYRTYVNWKLKEGKVFIPLYGDNGLKNQLSSDIKANNRFKQSFIEWVETLKKAWPNCPIYFEEENDPYKKGKRGNKVYKDGLFIEATDIAQLHVPPDLQIDLGKAIRESNRVTMKLGEKNFPYTKMGICPLCGQDGAFLFRKGVEGRDDYTTCPNMCSEKYISEKKWLKAQTENTIIPK